MSESSSVSQSAAAGGSLPSPGPATGHSENTTARAAGKTSEKTAAADNPQSKGSVTNRSSLKVPFILCLFRKCQCKVLGTAKGR